MMTKERGKVESSLAKQNLDKNDDLKRTECMKKTSPPPAYASFLGPASLSSQCDTPYPSAAADAEPFARLAGVVGSTLWGPTDI